jgi:CRISPR system Cascade subunit CasA
MDAGSSSNLYFNKPVPDFALCESCVAQALLTLQLNAPSGGRGIRVSLRGGGPLTTLLLPAQEPLKEPSSLWQKLWLNVLPLDALGYAPVKAMSDVLPWLAPTRTSDGKDSRDTPPESVHPLQAWWSMSRRIRLDATTVGHGDCSICDARGVRLFRHYRTRHGGTNYTGAWMHPLTPYSLDKKGEKPPISCKGRQAGRGYRDWAGLVLGNDDHQPDAARVMAHFTAKVKKPRVRLWCFGFDMSNMKALCWYDSTLPVHVIAPNLQLRFTKRVKQALDSADSQAYALREQIKVAWFSPQRLKRPDEQKRIAKSAAMAAIAQSFWQSTESAFYRLLDSLSVLDFDDEAELAPIYRVWLQGTCRQTLALFDHWVLSGPLEDQEMRRVIEARAALVKELNGGKAMKPLWEIVNLSQKEPA